MSTHPPLEWSSFNYNNYHTLDFKGADYLVFYPQQQIISFRLPSKIFGITYYQLMRYLLTFIYLNPDQTYEVYKEVLVALHINCLDKISDERIENIFEEAILLKDNKDLETVVLFQAETFQKSSYKGYIINPEVPQDKKDSVKGVARGEFRRIRTKEQIETVLKNWNPHWKKPTNRLISNKAKLSMKQVNTYMPLLKAERKKAASIKKEKKVNKTFKLLRKTLLYWDLAKGVPTNELLVKETGFRLDTIKTYSPKLKGFKKKIREAIKAKEDVISPPFFAPFDSKSFVNDHPDEQELIVNEYETDLQFESIAYSKQLEK